MRLSHLTGPNLEPKPGFTYEPRALWGRMLRQRTRPDGGGEPVVETFQQFGKEDFYNSGRWPIVITHMVVLSKPLEYATPFGAFHDFAQPQAQVPSVRITKMGSAPFSLDYQAGCIHWLGTTQSGPVGTDLHAPQISNRDARFLDGFNTVRWDLDLPLTVPDRGMVQFDLSGHPPLLELEQVGEDVAYVPVDVRSTLQFFENATAPQRTPGNSRTNVSDLRVMSERDARMFTTPEAVLAVQGIDATEIVPPTPFVGAATSTWDNGYGMPGRQFIARQASINRPSSISAMQVSLAKLVDDRLHFLPQEAGGFDVARQFQARTNLTQSIYARARVQQGGTNTWWWREGAPLALVMPSITPCPVYRFPTPVTLGLGEGFTVTGDIPTDALYPATETYTLGDDPTAYFYESHGFYVSFCGYACIPSRHG